MTNFFELNLFKPIKNFEEFLLKEITVFPAILIFFSFTKYFSVIYFLSTSQFWIVNKSILLIKFPLPFTSSINLIIVIHNSNNFFPNKILKSGLLC